MIALILNKDYAITSYATFICETCVNHRKCHTAIKKTLHILEKSMLQVPITFQLYWNLKRSKIWESSVEEFLTKENNIFSQENGIKEVQKVKLGSIGKTHAI